MTLPVKELIAKVLIINQDNEALVLKLGKHFIKPESSYKPDLPGGIADTGESAEDAIIRETNEETGILLEKSTLNLVYAGTKFYEAENKSVTRLLCISHISSTPSIKLSEEHEAFQWVKLDSNIAQTNFHGFYCEAVDYIILNKLT